MVVFLWLPSRALSFPGAPSSLEDIQRHTRMLPSSSLTRTERTMRIVTLHRALPPPPSIIDCAGARRMANRRRHNVSNRPNILLLLLLLGRHLLLLPQPGTTTTTSISSSNSSRMDRGREEGTVVVGRSTLTSVTSDGMTGSLLQLDTWLTSATETVPPSSMNTSTTRTMQSSSPSFTRSIQERCQDPAVSPPSSVPSQCSTSTAPLRSSSRTTKTWSSKSVDVDNDSTAL